VHYFEFFPDGSFSMWDRDRQYDGSFQQRGPFKGRYSHLSRATIEVTTGWNGYQARLEIDDAGGLKHGESFGLRSGLTFRRAGGE
jgi:hypothetical protein